MRAGEEDCKTYRLVPQSSPDLILRQGMSSRELRSEIMRHKDVSVESRAFLVLILCSDRLIRVSMLPAWYFQRTV